MTEIIENPFDWNDNFSEVAQEDFSMIQKCLSYGTVTTIGMALAKLELLEKQGCKVEQESEDKVDDAISRQKVLDVINLNWDFRRNCIRAIEKLPPVKQEPCSNCCNGNQIEKAKLCQKSYLAGMKHKQEPMTGRWVIAEDSNDRFFVTYECSCCKRAIIVPYDARNEVYKDYPYCHCGAKMVEPQERSDKG